MGTNEDDRTPDGDDRVDRAAESGEKSYEKQSQYIGVGIALGVSIGTAMSLALDNWAFAGVGIAIGVALGVAMGQRKQETDGDGTPPADAPDGPRS